jgi:hypothetical protein
MRSVLLPFAITAVVIRFPLKCRKPAPRQKAINMDVVLSSSPVLTILAPDYRDGIYSLIVLFLMNPYRAIPEKTASIVILCATLALVLFPVIVTAVTTTVDFYIFSHCHHPSGIPDRIPDSFRSFLLRPQVKRPDSCSLLSVPA